MKAEAKRKYRKAEEDAEQAREKATEKGTKPRQLPLFPLAMPLFPGITMPLQIFEPRYLAMIPRQLKRGAGFGVVTIKKGGEVGKAPTIYPVGVEVEIVDWYQQANQLLGIKVRGKRAFELESQQVEDDGLMVGIVRDLPMDDIELIPPEHNGLPALLQDLKQHPALANLEFPPPINSSQLAYQLAQLLPLSVELKMAAMKMAGAAPRLDFLAEQVGNLSNA